MSDFEVTAKQAYLREHVSTQKYEDFAEFCQSVAGNIDIEAWSFDYVCQLVNKFKKEEEQKERNKKKSGSSFHIYQTGNANQIKNVAQKLKEQNANKHNRQLMIEGNKSGSNGKNKSNQKAKYKQQKSALQVLDSIFEKHQPSEYETKKYDKAFFESCKFWDVPKNQQSNNHHHNNKQATPPKPKQSSKDQLNKYGTNTFIIQPQNFQKMFQTGIGFNESKQENKPIDNRIKKQIFEQIPLEDDINKVSQAKSKEKKSNNINVQTKSSPNNDKKNEIKLVSVKNIKNPRSQKIPYEGELLIKQPFKDKVACFKSFERHALSIKDLQVQIKNHEIINRSFFSSDYPMFHLKITPTNIICKRNLQDFQKLKRNLQGVYPGVKLPYLQKLGWLQSEVSPQYIERQKIYLTYFLKDVLHHNELRNSRILQDFLTLKDHKQIKRKFEQYDKIKKISSIEQLCLLKGEVDIQITEVNRQYNQYFEVFLSKMKAFWGQQQRILRQVNQIHIKLTQSYKSLQVLIDQISRQTKQFNKRVNINEIQFLEDAFLNLSQYVTENIRVNQKQSQFLQNFVLVYLKYQKQNMGMFDSIIDNRNSLTRSYLKRKDAQKSNDNLEYLSQRLKDYKTDILQQSKNITVLKYQCGYINNLLASEAQGYFHFLSEKMQKMISDLSYSKLEYLSKSINAYTSLVYA